MGRKCDQRPSSDDPHVPPEWDASLTKPQFATDEVDDSHQAQRLNNDRGKGHCDGHAYRQQNGYVVSCRRHTFTFSSGSPFAFKIPNPNPEFLRIKTNMSTS